MSWGLVPLEFAGLALVTAERDAYFLRAQGAHDSAQVQPIPVERTGRFPVLARVQPQGGKVFPVAFAMRDFDQAALVTLRALFDPLAGSGTLVMRDGDGILKQVSAVRRGLRRAGGVWIAPLWAPDPRLLESGLRTSTVTTLAGAEVGFIPVPNNIGDMDAEPLWRIKPQLLRTPRQAWAQVIEVTYGHRSEFPLTGPGSATGLLLVSPASWDTSAIIDVSAISTTISGDSIGAGDPVPFDLTVVSTAGFDQEGLLMITPGGSEEQFAYTIKNATEFTVTARALGGTAAVGHADAAVVHQSRMLKNGDDIAVFVDGRQVASQKVTVDAIDTADTKIWIELADAAAHSAVVRDGFGAGATAITFRNAAHGFRAGDYLVWIDSGSNDLKSRVTSVDGDTVTVVRQVHNSPAGATTNAGTTVYRSNHRIQLVYYYTAAASRPTNPDTPLIDTGLSDNTQWEWPSYPMWHVNTRRPGGWRPIIYSGRGDVAELRQNRMARKVALGTGGADTQFRDVEPSADEPNFDALEFVSPFGIRAAAGAIEYDATVGWPFALQVIGRDYQGYEQVISNRLGHESGNAHLLPTTYTNRQETPATTLSAVILRGRNIVVTTARPDDTTEESLVVAATVGHDFQRFTLDEETRVDGIVCRARMATAGDKGLSVQVNDEVSGNLAQRLIGPFAISFADAAFQIYCFFPGPGAAFTTDIPILNPGGYLVSMVESGSTGEINVPVSTAPIYPKGEHWEINSSAVIEKLEAEDLWFAILSLEADNQAEVEGNRTGESVDITNVTVLFDLTRTPIVDPRPAEDAYYVDDSLKLGAVELRLRYLARWADLTGETVTVDVTARTVVESKHGDGLRQVLTPQDSDWFLIPPGVQTVSVVANGGAVDEDHDLEYRSVWQG